MRVNLKMANIMEKELFMMKMETKSTVVVGRMETTHKVEIVNLCI